MRIPHQLLGLGLGLVLAATPVAGAELRDLFFGEALYHAYQGQYFDALQRLDTELAQYNGLDEPSLDTLHYHVNDAEFSVGDFELHYRMHHRAGRAIKAVLEGAVDEAVRNEAAFRLARIHFQKGQLEEGLHALDRIEGTVPPGLPDDIAFLRANLYMATGRPSDAVDELDQVQSDDGLAGFTAYNLGIALLQSGRPQEGIEQLDKAGLLAGGDGAGLAIRDKSNLVLGSILFESEEYERARRSLDRVRLEGPFSNQALLRAGWAEATAGSYDRALVPWNILVEREPTDAAVQEAMLAVPHAYSKLDLHGRAAIRYGQALELFSNQIERVDASLDSIRGGRFLDALIREEVRQDKQWVIRLRTMPDAPETYYLMELMATHDFQTALQNYLDLEDLRSKLLGWRDSLDAFEDIIRLREENYEPLLPGVDAQFRELDSRMRLRLAQRKHVGDRLQAMLTVPRPEYLATADEGIAGERIGRIEKRLGDSNDPDTAAFRERVARLRGVLTWRLETEYHERLTAAHEHLNELNVHVEALTRQYESFVRNRQAAMHSYVGYETRIKRLRTAVGDAMQRIDIVMARQGHLIETVAINQLKARREHLVAQQTQARYAVADSYDRAARADIGEVQP
ncbi:MAG: tetratricopeptide repeat protein [Acidobacteria bacterium]|uniref:Tetratricopeptide repeat protein n=1 Tax=Candidatus Polarisedimenticola svalbardensis TaxID=2886004 RepID=A0A8J6XUR7_9BACT|nr:tetratricopeptide repeat protein [Candidatus Polarisedimenticola svalbardensis]